jgi:DNA helicase IV
MERYGPQGTRITVAEHAGADRSWAFGHIVVDEAQELSPMAWRILFRRCPSRSMTVVGDLDQTSSLAGITAWADVFDRLTPGKWRTEQLTVNYRTPSPVMELAGSLLRAHGREPKVSASAREGEQPVVHPLSWRADIADVMRVIESELKSQPGRLCVIVPRSHLNDIDAAAHARFGDDVVGSGASTLDVQVSVMTAVQAKGLEFDTVVMVEPAQILAESVRGPRDLYVALTRPTSRLVIVHEDPLPAGMEHITR